MKTRRTYLLCIFSLLAAFLITGCSSADKAGTQARTDLTADHVRGLYSGMARKDVEDLLGTGDKSLADHEKIDVYSLSDGSTAVLRYRDDTLLGAYLRDKDNIETSIFGQDTTNTSGTNGVTDTGSSLENSDLNNAADSATEAGTENGMTSGGDSGIGTGTGIESESGK
ncbi:hypothetical protein [Frisingicoccus sp.]|uniref:hypothetical protein n=1 Tax=Frisingicoccus sp. TaxID=1918627 RepID=UPI003AB59683